MVRGIRAFVLCDLVDEWPAIPQRPWVGQGGASAPGGATHGPPPREAWVRRDWLHVVVRKREGVLGSARLSGACSRRARLHNNEFLLSGSAWWSGVVRLAPHNSRSACCSRSKIRKTLGCANHAYGLARRGPDEEVVVDFGGLGALDRGLRSPRLRAHAVWV